MKKRKVTHKVALILSLVCLMGMNLQVARADPGVQVLRKGQAAPENGVFYTDTVHAKLVAKLKGQAARCKEQTTHAVKVTTLKVTMELNKWKLEAASWKRQLTLSESFTKKQRDMLLKQVAKSQQVAWFRRPWFVAAVTVVLTVGVAAFSVWTFSELSENR